MDDGSLDNLSFLEMFLKLDELNRIEEENGTRVQRDEVKNRDEMLLKFSERVGRQMPLKIFIEKCRSVKEGADRIRLVTPFFEWIPTTVDFRKKFKKRSDLSSMYAEKAESAFHRGDYKLALDLCNLALAYAPPLGHDMRNGENGAIEMATGLYWRALILQKLNEPEGALCDLDLALSIHDFPQNTKKSIKTVQTFCQRAIGAMEDRDAALGLEETKLNLREAQRRQNFVEGLFQLKSINLLAPAMEDFVQIQFHPQKGRHLVAARDVPIGTTLLVETPIVAMLDGTLKLTTMHCHHCLKKNLRRVPCPNCVFALFCNENCMAAAAPYHQFECPCLPDLHAILDESVTDNFYLGPYSRECSVHNNKDRRGKPYK